MRVGYIYKITNPKGAVYIGQTRRLSHRKEVYRNVRCSKQIKLYNSLLKYGWINHNFEIIYEEECTKEQLNDLEISYISSYSSYNNRLGLNLTPGGGGGGKTGNRKGQSHTQEAKEKNRIAHKGRKVTEETRLKMSEAKKGKPKTISPEGRITAMQKLSIHQKEKWKNEEYANRVCKVILQYDKLGNFIRETNTWQLNKEGLNGHTINRCCRGLSKTSHGYVWKYKTKLNEKMA